MPKIDPTTLAEVREAFEQYKEACETSKLRPKAVETYTRYVDMFIRWLDDQFEPGATLN